MFARRETCQVVARRVALLFISVGLASIGCQQHVDSELESTAIDGFASPAIRVTTATPNEDAAVSFVATASSLAKNQKSPHHSESIPDWVTDAVFYQIFPERFRNGDPNNDPTRASLEFPENVSDSWTVTPWTNDWYSRSEWEIQRGTDFYNDGVFDRRYGGDLQGVLDKLDYLVDLGINTVYLNPVFYARSLHKYDGSSMHHIDPYFGPDPAGDLQLMSRETSDPDTWQWTAADKLFLKLIAAAHKRDIRIVIDGVFNHTGRDFFAFADLRENQAASAYRDWYIVQTFDDSQTAANEFRYKGWWGVDTLPEFADNSAGDDLHPGPKKYVMDITSRWMDPNGDGNPADGIDGWRLDVANEVPTGFWRDWNRHVRQLNPAAYTVGEFWEDARDPLIDGGFSGTMNYFGFAYLVKGFLIDGVLTAKDFAQQLETRRNRYPAEMQFALQNLIDSHDTDRVASMIVNAGKQEYAQLERFDFDVSERVTPRYNDKCEVRRPNEYERRIQRLVALMQMTYLGAPMLYYGTESGMWGADDPCDRMPMVWQDLAYDDQSTDPLGRPRSTDPVAFDDTLFDFYRQVIQLRRTLPALRGGKFEILDHDDEAQFFAFRRRLADQSLLVLINRGEQDYDWQFMIDNKLRLSQVFQASGNIEAAPVRRDGHVAMLTIPALDAVVLAEEPAQE